MNRHANVISNNSTVHLLCSGTAQTLAPLILDCPSHRSGCPCIWLKWHRALLPRLPSSCDVILPWLRSILMCQTSTTLNQNPACSSQTENRLVPGTGCPIFVQRLRKIPVTKQKLWQQQSRQNGTIFTQMRLLCPPDQSI